MELIDLQYKIHAAYGNLFAHTGDTLSAISSYIKSIEIIEDIRTQIAYEHSRSDFMQTVIPIYKELIYILLNQKNSHLAFDYYERMKARNLLEIIDGVEIVFENKISDEDLYQQSEISAEQKQNTLELNSYCESKEYKSRDLDKILSSQRSLLEKYIDFRSNIYMKYPEIKSKLEVKTPIKCEEAAMMLKARTQAALAYVVGEKQMYCFILKRPTELDYEVNVVSIPVSEKDIKEFTTNLIQEFQIQNQELLYLLLFKPITQYLQGISEICIIPDTYLYSIPFQALINPATKKFVIEDYAISYNYSLSLFKELNEIEHNTTKNILAFGNPDFKNLTIPGINHKFEALPKSEEEVLSIKELYGKDSEIYLGVKASESNFKAKAFNNHILHFATHGIFDNVNPMYSSLILTADTIDDGVLTAGEIFQMDLNAELVVLSACETAKGIMDDGEGILGLSRAFLGAKVPTIVATQWQVDDRSTKLLMEEFYKNLQINPNYTLAMQKAQLHLLNNTRYNNAYFWSPFIVLGASE